MKKKYILLIIILIITSIVGFGLYFNSLSKIIPKKDMLEDSLGLEPYFFMKDNLSCKVKIASDEEEKGKNISLLGLESNNPGVWFPDSVGLSPMIKLHDSEHTLVIGLIAEYTGSTDIFLLNKKSGIFVRTTSGNFLGMYGSVSKGNCK